MSFDRKLYQLRKEKGLSQEALAEQLDTSRQAISKWENGQGFPEIEKLIMLSDVFGVSTDYLLKDNLQGTGQEKGGYYVSKELAQSWLLHENITSRKIGFGLLFMIFAAIPFILIPYSSFAKIILGAMLALIGIGIILMMCLHDRDYDFKEIKRNALVFDNIYLSELRDKYIVLKKRYVHLILASLAFIILGAIFLFANDLMDENFRKIYIIFYIVGFAVSIGSLQHCFTMIDAYEILAFNEEHLNKFTTRLLSKTYDRLNRWLRK